MLSLIKHIKQRSTGDFLVWVIFTLWFWRFSSFLAKWKAHRMSGPWVVTGSQIAWDTVNGPKHDLSWSEPRFQHLGSLLLFSHRWLWKQKTDVQKRLAVTTQQVSLPKSCVTVNQPCTTITGLIISATGLHAFAVWKNAEWSAAVAEHYHDVY